MEYRIEVSSVAEAEADSAFVWISQVASLERAKEWYEGLLKTIQDLRINNEKRTFEIASLSLAMTEIGFFA